MRPTNYRLVAASASSAMLLAVVLAYPVLSQQPSATDQTMPNNMQHDHQKIMQQGKHGAGAPVLPGQDAFGAVQEIVRILDADPKTDWSKVNLEALRQHLIDMNELTLRAESVAKSIDGGLEITVTGSGRTVAAIQRMVPAWAATLNGYKGWTTKAAALPNGELLTVTAADAKEVPHIRGLGFLGLMASGAHHQLHHLAMAKGEFAHQH